MTCLDLYIKQRIQRARERANDPNAEDDSWEGNPYLEDCHDREMRARRREEDRLNEAEFEEL
jgi:hypothetical protein